MCMHGKLLQSFLTLYDPMDYSPPGSSVHETLQVKLLGKKKKEYWSGLLFPSQGYLPHLRTEHVS